MVSPTKQPSKRDLILHSNNEQNYIEVSSHHTLSDVRILIQQELDIEQLPDEQFSFKQLNEASNRIANGLSDMGIRKGDHVVTILPNYPEYLYIWWGIVKLGAIHIPIDGNYRGDTLVNLLNRSNAKRCCNPVGFP